MSCHTWFYKKNTFPVEELHLRALENIEGLITDLKETAKENKTSKTPDYGMFSDENKPRKKFNKSIITALKYKSKIRRISEFLRLFDDYDVFVRKEGYSFDCIKGVIYYDDGTCPHDLFRQKDYPQISLHSLEQTIKYISDPKNKCIVFEDTIEQLQKFWSETPDGVITFG